jgi:hypothetical protein
VPGVVAGHVEHRQVGQAPPQLGGELGAGPGGHPHVGEEQVDRAVVGRRDGEGLRGAVGYQDPVAAAGQDALGDVAHPWLVVDREDRRSGRVAHAAPTCNVP